MTPLLAALLLAGCAGAGGPAGLFKGGDGAGGPAPAAGTLPELPADGPAAPTAVIETSYTLDGAILPVTRGQMRTDTRADMRRNDSVLTFDNWLIRQVAGDGRNADIVRLDRRLEWRLEPSKKLYTECPITGCPSQSPSKPAQEQKPEQQSKAKEPDCPLTLKTNDLKVSASGERKTVNGFATERYQVGWTIELQDGQGRRNTNKVAIDLWTTPESGPVHDVQQVNENYQRRYLAALNSGDNPIGKYLPKEVLAAMSRMMKNIDPSDAKSMAAFAGELRKVRGYPIQTNMSWTSDGSVCSDSSAGAAPSMSSLSSMLGSITGKPAASGGPTPLVTYSHEVKSMSVRPVSDSVFVVPPDYQRK